MGKVLTLGLSLRRRAACRGWAGEEEEEKKQAEIQTGSKEISKAPGLGRVLGLQREITRFSESQGWRARGQCGEER